MEEAWEKMSHLLYIWLFRILKIILFTNKRQKTWCGITVIAELQLNVFLQIRLVLDPGLIYQKKRVIKN